VRPGPPPAESRGKPRKILYRRRKTMKRLLAALILISAAGWNAQAQTADELSLSGVEVSRGIRGALLLVGRASGRRPGSFQVNIRYNPATGKVLGGSWKLTLMRRGPFKVPQPEGSLQGTISDGTVGLNRHGRVESLKGVRLLPEGGAGSAPRGRGVAGEAEGTFDARRRQPFSGKLRLPI
jgi:hypothetical protein